ncbi:MAG: hypothetical protein LLG44_01765, partial [Chloroflexi bacterium]|nr:hypothetical protein [Chloroflexota bacterium]
APAEDIREQVRALMDDACSVIRTEEQLRVALRAIKRMRKQGVSACGTTLARALEAWNILVTAELVVTAALARDESRGPHLRFAGSTSFEPLPSREPDWRQYIVLRAAEGEPTVERRTPVQLTLPAGSDTITY